MPKTYTCGHCNRPCKKMYWRVVTNLNTSEQFGGYMCRQCYKTIERGFAGHEVKGSQMEYGKEGIGSYTVTG